MALLVSLAAAPASGGDGATGPPPLPPRARVALVGAEATVAPVRAVVGELLARAGVTVAWSRLDGLRPTEILEEVDGDGDGARADLRTIAVWIDLTSADAGVRLYFRDAPGQRFVFRRPVFPSGIGALAVEQIAQIVKSVVLALGAQTEPALSRSEARAALRETIAATPPAPLPSPPAFLPAPPAPLPAPPAPLPATVAPLPATVAPVPATVAPLPATPAPLLATVAPPLRPRLAFELGAAVVGQLFAREIPVSERLDLAVSVLARPGATRDHAFGTAFGAWLAFGYAAPIHFSGGAVGVDLGTLALRAGVLWEAWRSRLLSLRLGLGGGVDRVTFQPRADAPGVDAAASGRFFTPLASTTIGFNLGRPGGPALAIAVVVDLTETSVHYDVRQPDGSVTRVIAPFQVRPGLSAGIGWRF